MKTMAIAGWTVTLILGLIAVLGAQQPGSMMRPQSPMMQRPMSQGMMQMHMMFCPMREPSVQIEVKPIEDGVQITLKAKDPEVVQRIQKKAELMRLMHELMQTMRHSWER